MTNRREVQRLVSRAVHLAHERNAELWRMGAGERTKVSQIFAELRPLFPDWDVDNEYNRQGSQGSPKLRTNLAGTLTKGTPDLVVHHRGESTSRHNLLTMEIKPTYQNLVLAPTPAHPEDYDDFLKVREWMRVFGYRYGAVIGLGKTTKEFDPRVIWFKRTSDGPVHGGIVRLTRSTTV